MVVVMAYKRLIIIQLFTIIMWILCIHSHEIKRISVLEVTAVDGGKAALPCDVQHPSDDTVFLVLWFNDNLTTPIYSYDIRPGVRDSVIHWKDTTVLGERANLIVSERIAELQLSPLHEKDEGFYKCRVDFRQQPTRTTRINLKVIVPPESLSITQLGATVTSVIGPFQEGDSTTLTCTAYGGRPLPKVYWYFGDRIIDDIMDSVDTNVIRNETKHDRKLRSLPKWKLRRYRKQTNTISLGPFDRNDLKKLVTCEASNSNLSSPMSEAVMIDMNLPPLSIFIYGPTDAISAGKKYTLICEVTGSRPPPSITWMKGSSRIQGQTEITSTDGNITKSSLTLIPRPPDDGTIISCKAKNQATKTSLQKSISLTVNFVPEAVISLASFLESKNIKEGDDVYFECSITANPTVYKITWHHNGIIIEPNISGGVIVSNQSLVIQHVKREHAGMYSCTASNIEGDGLASSVTLDIKYAPVCSPHQITTYGVAKKEDAEVTCEVKANPAALSFKWTFNNTADTIDVPPGRYTTTKESSIITYTPVTELDFGTLLCWAVNDIGGQKTPCLFHIVPAGRPDPPTNCSIVNTTSVSFGVWCQKAFDGGLHQVFLMRVSKSGGIGINYTHGEPSFKVANLNPGNSYRLQIWAANDKGSSVPVHLNAFTYRVSSNNPSHGPSEAEVREGYVNRGESENLGDYHPRSTNEANNMHSKIKAAQEWEWELTMTGIIPLIAGAILVGLLILLVTGLLLRHKFKKVRDATRHVLEKEDNSETNVHRQSSSASMLLHVRNSKTSAICNQRELQLEPENSFERENISCLDLDASGPLIRPPLTYAGQGIKGCYRHLQADQSGSPQHSLISHLHEKGGIVTFRSTTANLGSQCFAPHHPPPPSRNQVHQHIIQRHHINTNTTADFNSLDMPAAQLALTLPRQAYHKDVPTVYATLDSRAKRLSLKSAHSQASLHDQTIHSKNYEGVSPVNFNPRQEYPSEDKSEELTKRDKRESSV